MEKEIKISIVIPTNGNHSYITRAIFSCIEQKLDRNKFEILVISNTVDSNFKNNVLEKFSNIENLKFFEAKMKGVNAARNLGLISAKGKWIYFLDDDCALPNEYFLSQVLTQIDSQLNKAIKVWGGYYRDSTSFSSRYFWTYFYNCLCNIWVDYYSNSDGVDSIRSLRLLGGNLILHREIADEGFLFDEKIFYGGAESEFEQRLIDAGYSFSLRNDLSIVHAPVLSLTDLACKSYLQQKNKYSQKSNRKKRKRLLPYYAFLKNIIGE